MLLAAVSPVVSHLTLVDPVVSNLNTQRTSDRLLHHSLRASRASNDAATETRRRERQAAQRERHDYLAAFDPERPLYRDAWAINRKQFPAEVAGVTEPYLYCHIEANKETYQTRTGQTVAEAGATARRAIAMILVEEAKAIRDRAWKQGDASLAGAADAKSSLGVVSRQMHEHAKACTCTRSYRSACPEIKERIGY